MKLTGVIYFALLCSSSLLAQQSYIHIYVNGCIDTANVEISQEIQVGQSPFTDFIGTKPSHYTTQ